MASQADLDSLLKQREEVLNFINANINDPSKAPNITGAKSFLNAVDASINNTIALIAQEKERLSPTVATNTTISNLQQQLNNAIATNNANYDTSKPRTLQEQTQLNTVDALQSQLTDARVNQAVKSGVVNIPISPTSPISPALTTTDSTPQYITAQDITAQEPSPVSFIQAPSPIATTDSTPQYITAQDITAQEPSPVSFIPAPSPIATGTPALTTTGTPTVDAWWKNRGFKSEFSANMAGYFDDVYKNPSKNPTPPTQDDIDKHQAEKLAQYNALFGTNATLNADGSVNMDTVQKTVSDQAVTPSTNSVDTLNSLGDTANTGKINTQGALTTTGTPALTTTGTPALTTTGTPALTTTGTPALTTTGTPALTTDDLVNWSNTQPKAITADQLKTALEGQQTTLTSQNADFLKNWNTSADALKNSILSGVDTKNQQFGTQATQGFMDAFKNFQIPTNQQTGVNLGNYNDNRNAAADQWWSQYVTGRR
jgi:hypothetical protein